MVTSSGAGPGDPSESETATGGLDEDSGQLDDVGVVVRVAGQLDDPLLAPEAHARAPSGSGRRRA